MSYGQSYDHLVKITAGDDPAHNLQLKAAVKSGESWNAGAAITKETASGQWIAAGKNTDKDRLVCIAINGTADLDVDSGDEYNVANATKIGAFPCSGNFEFKTTEFAADTYAINDKLSPSEVTDAESTLIKETGTLGDTGFCGIVTEVPFTQKGYDISVIQFLGVYFPGHAHA